MTTSDMNYNRLLQNLFKFGRDRSWNLVCDSYKPQLRQDKKFQQWQRLCRRCAIKAMSDAERKALNNIMEIGMTRKRAMVNLARNGHVVISI